MEGRGFVMIKDTIRKFIQRFVSKKNFEDDTNIFENGLVNSLFAMQMVSFIEKEYDITVQNEDIDLSNFKDVNSIVKLIEAKLS